MDYGLGFPSGLGAKVIRSRGLRFVGLRKSWGIGCGIERIRM